MAKLPISRVVNVTLTRADNFASATGFGVPLIITSETSGPVSASVRTYVYGSMDEVAADWDAASSVYLAANAIFSLAVAPTQVKVGFVDAGVYAATPTKDMADELDALQAYDGDWYFMTFTRPFRDKDAAIDAAIAWVEAKRHVLFLDSNDSATESAANATSVAARSKCCYERTAIFYHTDPDVYFAAAAAGYCATRDFDEANSAYTLKFKTLNGITPINKPSAVIQAVTGFVPGMGLSTTAGHMANAYVDIGGISMVVEGSVASGAFIDEIHASDWIIARTEEELLSRLANNARIPYTNPGIQILVDGVEAILNRAYTAGLVAETQDDNGDYLPAYEVKVERVEAVLESRRRQRIAPQIQACFRYAGAVHYTSVAYTMNF